MAFRCWCEEAYQHPAVKADAERQVNSREYQQSPEALQEEGHQADLERVGVEHHQQNDDHVEQDGNVLNAVETNCTNVIMVCGCV